MTLIYRIFLKGLFTLLPISLTLALLIWAARQTEEVFADPLRKQFPVIFGFTGAGFAVALVLIFLVGLLVNTYLTRRLVEWFESKLESLPIVRAIYNPIRDVTNLFAHPDGKSEQKVVMVRLADNGPELMGLVTRDSFQDLPDDVVKKDSIAVFLPFSYGMGGFTALVAKDRVRETHLSAERAMQLAITGWIKATPHK